MKKSEAPIEVRGHKIWKVMFTLNKHLPETQAIGGREKDVEPEREKRKGMLKDTIKNLKSEGVRERAVSRQLRREKGE